MKDAQTLLIELLNLSFDMTVEHDGILLCDEDLEELFLFSSLHALSPMLADILLKNKLVSDKYAQKLNNIVLSSVFHYQKQSAEYVKICSLFEKNQIDFIPLKGSVLRNFYAEPWLRTSCDIDILIRKEDLEKATLLLEEEGYTHINNGFHDVSFHSPSGVLFELHFYSIEKEFALANVNEVLDRIWDYSVLKEGKKHEYLLTDEMFYFYHISHMLKHFKIGGCGIRPFLDLWIMKDHLNCDEDKKTELLEKGGILKFSKESENLCKVWFGGNTHSEITKEMEKYIFQGGIYGNMENHIAMKRAQHKGRLATLWKKIFLNYDYLKLMYPRLQKYPILVPFYQIRRLVRAIFVKKYRTRAFNYLLLNDTLPKDLETQATILRKYFDI